MKQRVGFVSNSSSSSFICDVCGGIESGYDASYSDFDMFECENGHVFHDSCSPIGVKEPTIDSMKERVKRHYEKDIEYWTRNSSSSSEKYIREYNNDLIKLETISEDDLENIYRDIVDDCGISSEFCPICQMTKVTPSDMKKFIYKKYELTEEKLVKEIKEQFSSYSEFKEFLKK